MKTLLAKNLVANPSARAVAPGATTLRANLCTSASFESPGSKWGSWQAADFDSVLSTEWARTGLQSLKAFVPAGSTLNTGGIQYTYVGAAGELHETVVYTATAYLYVPPNMPIIGKNVLFVLRCDGDLPSVNGSAGSVTTIHTLKAGLQRVSVSLTLGKLTGGSTTYKSLNLQLSRGSGSNLSPNDFFYADDVLIEQTDQDRDYFDGSTVDSNGWDYSWVGSVNASASVAKASSVVVRENLLSDPGGTNALKWNTYGGAGSMTYVNLSSVDASWSPSGKAMRITGLSGATAIHCEISPTRPPATIPVVAGEVLTALFKVRSSRHRTVFIRLRGNISGDFISPNKNAEIVEGYISHTFVGLPTDAYAVTIKSDDGTFDGEWFEAIGTVVKGTINEYFDGNTPSQGDFKNIWSGAANASSSQQVAPAVDGISKVNGVVYQGTETDGTKTAALYSALAVQHRYEWRVSGLTIGKQYTATVLIKETLANQTWHIDATNQDGTILYVTGGNVIVSTTGYSTLTVIFVAGDTTCMLKIRSNDSNSSTSYIKNFSIVEGTYQGQFFDGDFEDFGMSVYEWTGTPNASASTWSSDEDLSTPGLTINDNIMNQLTLMGYTTGTINDRERARLIDKSKVANPEKLSILDLYVSAGEEFRL